MRGQRLVYRLIGFTLLATVVGCAGFHTYRTVAVQVRDAETKKPIAGAKVRIWYPVAREASAPYEASGVTGADGTVALRAAPFYESEIQVEGSAADYLLDQTNLSEAAVQQAEAKHSFAGGPPIPVVIEMYAGPHPTVELTFPVGYRGLVKAQVHVREDMASSPGQRCFKYEVSPNGAVTVEGPPLLRRVNSPNFTGRFADGTLLPKQPRDMDVALRIVRSDGDVHYFVVGTQFEADEYRHSQQREAAAERHSSGGKGGGRSSRHRGAN